MTERRCLSAVRERRAAGCESKLRCAAQRHEGQVLVAAWELDVQFQFCTRFSPDERPRSSAG